MKRKKVLAILGSAFLSVMTLSGCSVSEPTTCAYGPAPVVTDWDDTELIEERVNINEERELLYGPAPSIEVEEMEMTPDLYGPAPTEIYPNGGDIEEPITVEYGVVVLEEDTEYIENENFRPVEAQIVALYGVEAPRDEISFNENYKERKDNKKSIEESIMVVYGVKTPEDGTKFV